MESHDSEFSDPIGTQARQAVQGTLPVDYPAAYVDELIARADFAMHLIQENLDSARQTLAKLHTEVRRG